MEGKKKVSANGKCNFSLIFSEELYTLLKETAKSLDLTMTDFVSIAIREKIERGSVSTEPPQFTGLSSLEDRLDKITNILTDIHSIQQRKLDSLKNLL